MQEFGPMNRGFASYRFPRTIALVGKYHSQEIAESLRRLAEYLYERGVSVFIERETAENIGKKVDLSRWVTCGFNDIGAHADLAIVLGGDGKGQDFSPLRESFARHARAVVLIGRDGPLIADAVAGCGVEIVSAPDMDAAVAAANRLATSADAVMLSPACASFDMFRSYAHRAQVFCAAVLALPGVVKP